MAWGAIGGAAVGVAGGLLSGGPGHANDRVDPATAEDQYLGSALGGVNDIMSGVSGLPMQQYYQGSTVAGQNPMYAGSINNMYNNPYGGSYRDAAGNYGIRSFDAMTNVLNDPSGAFKYNQGVFDQTMGNLMPAMQGSYDAATRDNNRQLNWSTLPGLDMGAAGAGQQGGTKLGQQSALAQSMTMDRNADIGASMYQNAVNQAQDAAMQAGTQNLTAQQNMFGIGSNALNNAASFNDSMLRNQFLAGTTAQGYDQSLLSDDVARWNFNQNQPWQHANDQLSLYNSTRLSNPQSTQPNPYIGASPFEQATQGAMMGLGIYGAGQDAGWWGGGSQLQTINTDYLNGVGKLQPFDTSMYSGMYR